MSGYPILHACITADGSVIIGTHGRGADDVILLDSTVEFLERHKRQRILKETLGEPWMPVPYRALHEVLGEVEGRIVTAEMVGYAFNDAEMLDRICGPGTYARVMPGFERQLLEMARPLYEIRAEGIDK